jgi:hypothetical protein
LSRSTSASDDWHTKSLSSIPSGITNITQQISWRNLFLLGLLYL